MGVSDEECVDLPGYLRRKQAECPRLQSWDECPPQMHLLEQIVYKVIRKSYRYRLYPTKAQVTLLEKTVYTCRWVYNETLALRKNAWEQEQRSLSYYDTNKILTQLKKDHPELNPVYSQVLQNVQMRVDLAFKAFFQRVKAGENPGYPRFKGKGRYDSFTYPQSGFHLNDHPYRPPPPDRR